jgi:hypothetical protein
VHRENIEGIIDSENKLEFGGVIGETSSKEAKNNGSPDWNITLKIK